MVLNVHKNHKAYWGRGWGIGGVDGGWDGRGGGWGWGGGGGMDEGEEGDVCEFAVDLYLNIFITESV